MTTAIMRPICFLVLFSLTVLASPQCKAAPSDLEWPAPNEWKALNVSIGGVLIKAYPAASSCYNNTAFDSPYSCQDVAANWTLAKFHSTLPESIDYPIWANNSCLPPGTTGYDPSRGCSLGGSPQFIVNATTERQIAIAAKWAADRNIRIVIKGTGHDLNGR